MPYDPNNPANNTALSSAEMRAQLQALDADKASHEELSAAISGTSSNSDCVKPPHSPTPVPVLTVSGAAGAAQPLKLSHVFAKSGPS